jgi:hypothetical protein
MISVLSGLNDISHFFLPYIQFIQIISNNIVQLQHVNYGITVGLEIHKNWNNFNWKLPELLQAYLFLPKLKFYIERQVGNYYLRDGREGNFNFFIKIPLIIFVHWFPPPYNIRQCIRWEMGMILFYPSVDCLRLVIPLSLPQ